MIMYVCVYTYIHIHAQIFSTCAWITNHLLVWMHHQLPPIPDRVHLPVDLLSAERRHLLRFDVVVCASF